MARDNLGVAPSATSDLVRKVDLTATNTAFTPTGDIAATDVQAAIAEMLSEAFPQGWGAWSTYTPTLVQNVTVTKTVQYARYIQVGKSVLCQFAVTATSSGTAGNFITAGLPITSATHYNISGAFASLGSFVFNDVSAATGTSGTVGWVTATTVSFRSSPSGVSIGLAGSSFTGAIANGDQITASLMYELP